MVVVPSPDQLLVPISILELKNNNNNNYQGHSIVPLQQYQVQYWSILPVVGEALAQL